MPTPIKVSDEKLKKIIELNPGKSMTAIHALTGVSSKRIKRIAEANNLELKSNYCSKEETARRIQHIKDNPDTKAEYLAKFLGVQPATIYWLAIKHDLEIVRSKRKYSEKLINKKKQLRFIRRNSNLTRLEMAKALGIHRTTLYDLVLENKLSYTHGVSGELIECHNKREDGLFLDLNRTPAGRAKLNAFLSASWN